MNWEELETKVWQMGRKISKLRDKDSKLLKNLRELDSKIKELRVKRNNARKAIAHNQVAWSRLGNSMSTYSGCLIGVGLKRNFERYVDQTKSMIRARESIYSTRKELKDKIYLVSRQVTDAQIDREIVDVVDKSDGTTIMKIKFTAYIRSTMVEDIHIITYIKKTDGVWYKKKDNGNETIINPNYSKPPLSSIERRKILNTKKNKHEELETLLKTWREITSNKN